MSGPGSWFGSTGETKWTEDDSKYTSNDKPLSERLNVPGFNLFVEDVQKWCEDSVNGLQEFTSDVKDRTIDLMEAAKQSYRETSETASKIWTDASEWTVSTTQPVLEWMQSYRLLPALGMDDTQRQLDAASTYVVKIMQETTDYYLVEFPQQSSAVHEFL